MLICGPDMVENPMVKIGPWSQLLGMWSGLDQSQAVLRKFSVPQGEQPFCILWWRPMLSRWRTEKLRIKSIANKIGSFQFLPTGLHGLCFGCCFSGPLPLRSLINGPPIGVRFRESLAVRLYSEIDQIHLSIEAQCLITLLPPGDCHKMTAFSLNVGVSKMEMHRLHFYLPMH